MELEKKPLHIRHILYYCVNLLLTLLPCACNPTTLRLLFNLLLGFCGGSNPDSTYASQQPGGDQEWSHAGLERSCQSNLVTGANMDSWLLWLGARQNSSAVPVLWTQQPARLSFCTEAVNESSITSR